MTQDPIEESVVIIGAGPAGLSAALYAARAELSPLVLTGMQPGGQAALTFAIENYPGFPDGVGGSELGDLFQKQAERFGARVEFDSVTSVDLKTRPFWLKLIIVKSWQNRYYRNWRQFDPFGGSGRKRVGGQGCILLRHVRWVVFQRERSDRGWRR